MLDGIYNYQQFADFLGVNPKAIKFFAYSRKGRARAYRKFSLPKKGGGTRTICSPARGLYIIQRAILDKILTPDNLKNRYCVFSYTPDRGALDMAARHVSRDFVVRIDIENFFGSITFPRVLGALQAFPLKVPYKWAVVIAQLCTCDGVLPQGAPTSPSISNLIARRMDGELIRFAKEHGFRYSRYSDDLVFSGKTRRRLSVLVERDEKTFTYVVAEPVRSIIDGNHFRLNQSKTRVSFRQNKQMVVGAVCNKKVNVDRKYIRQIRTLLHLSRKSQNEALSAYHAWIGRNRTTRIDAVIQSKIEYVRAAKGSSDTVFINLAEQFNSIFVGTAKIRLRKVTSKKSNAIDEKHVLICKAMHKIYGDPEFGEADEAVLFKSGTCFFLEGVGLVTSFHTLLHNVSVFSATNTKFDFKIDDAVFCDRKQDIAILDGSKIFLSFYKEMRAEMVWPTQPGDTVIALGYPHYTEGDMLSRKIGKITQLKNAFGISLYSVDIDIKEGESGGPVINERGRVIGIVSDLPPENRTI